MPAVSSQQRRWAFAVKGAAWARKHHFDTPGSLPRYAKKKTGTARLAERMAERRR
jgi:hypothetical protein